MSAGAVVSELDGHPILHVKEGGWHPSYLERIRREGLRGLSIRVFDDDATFLRELPSLRVLVLNSGSIRDLQPVEALPNLESLTLNTVRRPKLPLDFSAFPRLRSFGGYWNDGFRSLFQSASRLEELFLFGPPDVDLLQFGALGGLARLELSQGRRLRSLRGIENLRELTVLGLYGQSSLATLDGLEAATGLRELSIEACKRVSSLAAIRELRDLRSLKFANCGEVDSLEPLAALDALEGFFAWESTNVRDGDLGVLARLPALKTVAMQARDHYHPTVAEVEAALGD